MALKYPLHLYDEAGRMKPPIFIYGLMCFVCRGLLILIVSLSSQGDSERLLRVFYPEPYHFYLALIPILPALISLAIVSRRGSIWKSSSYRVFTFIPLLVFTALAIDIGVQVYMLNQTDYAFSMARGIFIIVGVSGILYFYRSRYIKHLIIDWSKP